MNLVTVKIATDKSIVMIESPGPVPCCDICPVLSMCCSRVRSRRDSAGLQLCAGCASGTERDTQSLTI